MTNKIATPKLNTLEAEGLELSRKWREISKADKARFQKAIQSDGFDTRLGRLLQSLKAEAEGGRISSQRLRDCNLHIIDKRRRAEALWFVENEKACKAFVKASKKGFTSLTALQSAMRKAEKAKASKEENKSKAEKAETSKEENKSNVGPKTATDIALEALVQCDINGVNVEDFLLSLKEQLELLDIKHAA